MANTAAIHVVCPRASDHNETAATGETRGGRPRTPNRGATAELRASRGCSVQVVVVVVVLLALGI
jgi:hypothetical protein